MCQILLKMVSSYSYSFLQWITIYFCSFIGQFSVNLTEGENPLIFKLYSEVIVKRNFVKLNHYLYVKKSKFVLGFIEIL